ncbi:MAG TPA: type VI secretion system baseplate subunit TssE [Pyrinomonadaceae bacterium]|nr:type VI secretion system baseplate subunit TssE [Pyrinomonadaceae bacterium]
MARTDNEVQITPSVLDRLLDYEPEVTREPISSRSKTLRQLKQSVRRDLEWLLNTRQALLGLSSDMKETNNSVATFGLPDFTHLSIDSAGDQKFIKREIEETVRRFEQRLESVVVSIEPVRSVERILRFRIDARLKIDPAPEPITFDTVLQLGSGQYMVQGE